jgi:hypothetical protein
MSVIALLISVAALAFSYLTYIARNRPFVGVKSLNASHPSHNGARELAVEVENVGEVPALEVTIKVSDSGGLFEDPAFFLGAIFPGQSTTIRFPVPESFTYAPDKGLSYLAPVPAMERQRRGLGENAEKLIQVYPEGHEATMVTCHITYQGPLILGFIPRGIFQTVQPFRVEHSGRAQPARSKQAKVS